MVENMVRERKRERERESRAEIHMACGKDTGFILGQVVC